jgi:subfamily B ATP-binding cassette protein MsbA
MNRLNKTWQSERVRNLLTQVWLLVKPVRVIFAISLTLMVINRLAGLVLPTSMKFLIDDVLGRRQYRLLAFVVLAVIAAGLIQGTTSFVIARIVTRAAHRLITDLRCKVQAHITRLSIDYHDENTVGVRLSRIMNDIDGIRGFVGTSLIDLSGAMLTAAMALVIMIRISIPMTAVTVAMMVIFGSGVFTVFHKMRSLYWARAAIYAEVTGRLAESLGGVRVVKGYHAEEREAQVFSSGAQRMFENAIQILAATSSMNFAATTLPALMAAVMMYIGCRQILAGALTLGAFITFTAFMALLVAPVFQIVAIGSQLSEAAAGLERTREVLRVRPEDEDPRRTVLLPAIRGAVTFKNVSFAYKADQTVLHGISFEAQPGTVTALVGPSGSGKSTIIGLVLAFYAPNSGSIAIDGADLSTVRLDTYRTQFGVVLQDSFLFDGTIRDNIAFSRPDATGEEILRAARIARVDEFVRGFEKKYDTLAGERGVKLSGGQRQRISIARAILADPKILILDEATSSLDSESEALIQQGLSYLMNGRTTFVIAHRLSTIRHADQILVIEEGRIVERGNHHALHEAKGRYFEFYERQHSLEANMFRAPGEADGSETEELTIVPAPPRDNMIETLRFV